MTLSIYLCSYSRGNDAHGKPNPYHWSFFIMTNATTTDGLSYQIQGTPGGFHYSGPQEATLNPASTLQARLEIGTIPTDTLDDFAGVLSTVPIDNDGFSSWNSQDWSMAAIKELFHRQWIWYDGPTIKTSLLEEEANAKR